MSNKYIIDLTYTELVDAIDNNIKRAAPGVQYDFYKALYALCENKIKILNKKS